MLSGTRPRKLPGVVGWVKLAGRSFVGAVLVGAAQLGAAQALAILVWSTVPTTDVWRRQLTWLVFIFAGAVLGGVVTGRRSVRTIRRAIANRRADAAAARHAGLVVHQRGLIAAQRRAVAAARGKTVDTARGVAAGAARVCATVFAALGAATSFALVWLPARNAYDAADLRVLSVAAGLGVVVGTVLSLLCLTAAPVAANVGVSLAGVWLFGLASVGMTIATDEPSITPRLGVLDSPTMIGPDEWWLGPNLMVAVAAILGFAVAATARWIGAHRVAIALSGLAGPTVVAAAYLLVGPAGELMSSYVAALLAATVGLLSSAATAAANRGTAEQQTTGRTPAALTAGPAAAPRRPLAIESGWPRSPARSTQQRSTPRLPTPARLNRAPPMPTPPMPVPRLASQRRDGPSLVAPPRHVGQPSRHTRPQSRCTWHRHAPRLSPRPGHRRRHRSSGPCLWRPRRHRFRPGQWPRRRTPLPLRRRHQPRAQLRLPRHRLHHSRGPCLRHPRVPRPRLPSRLRHHPLRRHLQLLRPRPLRPRPPCRGPTTGTTHRHYATASGSEPAGTEGRGAPTSHSPVSRGPAAAGPANQRPSRPTPSQPTPSQPRPSQPKPSQPKPSQPRPSQPTPSQPLANQLRANQPLAKQVRPHRPRWSRQQAKPPPRSRRAGVGAAERTVQRPRREPPARPK